MQPRKRGKANETKGPGKRLIFFLIGTPSHQKTVSEGWAGDGVWAGGTRGRGPYPGPKYHASTAAAS